MIITRKFSVKISVTSNQQRSTCKMPSLQWL